MSADLSLGVIWLLIFGGVGCITLLVLWSAQ